MEFIFDHDLHIHSYISPCAPKEAREQQTVERILRYADENNLKTLCVTDHFWDEKVTPPEGIGFIHLYSFERIKAIRPLPQSEKVKFLFGCEVEMHADGRIAISEDRINEFDFINVATTHFHNGYSITAEEAQDAKSRAKAWVKKFDTLLNSDLPFKKVGIAHINTRLLAPTREMYLEVMDIIPQSEMERLFKRSAELGIGIELNSSEMKFTQETAELTLKPLYIAKQCGCKFFCGTDAHTPNEFDNAKEIFDVTIKKLGLLESDKFTVI